MRSTRKAELPGARMHRMHMEALRAKGHVDALMEQYRVFADALGVTEMDRTVIMRHRQTLDVHEDEDFLFSLVCALKETTAAASTVRSAVERRKEMIALIEIDLQLAKEERISEDELSERMQFSTQLLQKVSVDVCEGVAKWRQLLSNPLPFLDDDGNNVILAMIEDSFRWSKNKMWGPTHTRIAFDVHDPCGRAREGSTTPAKTPEHGGALVVVGGELSNTSLGSVPSSLGHLRTQQPSPLSNTKRRKQAELLEGAGTFPHTISRTRPSASQGGEPRAATPSAGPHDKKADTTASKTVVEEDFQTRLQFSNQYVTGEYALLISLFRSRVEAAQNGVFLPILRQVFDRLGPQQIPDPYLESERKEAVSSFRSFCHNYSLKEKEERHFLHRRREYVDFAFRRGLLGLPAKKVPPYLQHNRKYRTSETTTAQQLLMTNVLRELLKWYTQWIDFVSYRRQRRQLAESLRWLSDKAHMRQRFDDWLLFVERRRHQLAVEQAYESKADADLSAPSVPVLETPQHLSLNPNVSEVASHYGPAYYNTPVRSRTTIPSPAVEEMSPSGGRSVACQTTSTSTHNKKDHHTAVAASPSASRHRPASRNHHVPRR